MHILALWLYNKLHGRSSTRRTLHRPQGRLRLSALALDSRPWTAQVNVNAQTKSGHTALMYAAGSKYGGEDLVEARAREVHCSYARGGDVAELQIRGWSEFLPDFRYVAGRGGSCSVNVF